MSAAHNIIASFPAEPTPATIVDHLGGGFEPKLVQAYFTGRKWNTLNASELTSHYSGDAGSALTFMSDTAARYYLPAFLMICLHERVCADLIVERTLWQLTAPTDALGLQRFLTRYTPLTAEQKAAIALSLKEIEQSGICMSDSQSAYNSYWHQFDPTRKDSAPNSQ